MLLSEIFIIGFIAIVVFLLFANHGGLFRSVKNRVNKAAADINDQVRDPVADARATIELATKQLDALNEQRRRLRVNTLTLEQKQKQHTQNVEKYESLAKSEGLQGHRDNVVQLLASKAASARELESVTNEITKNNALDAEIQAKAENLRSKLEHAKAGASGMETRLRYATLRQEIAQSTAGHADTEASLDRLEQDVNRAEAEAQSWETQNGETTSLADRLTRKYDAAAPSDEEIAKYLAPAQPAQS